MTKSGPLSFLNTKSWHVTTVANQRKLYAAEEKKRDNEKRQREYERQFTQEQEYWRNLQAVKSRADPPKKKEDTLQFMYSSPPGMLADKLAAARKVEEQKEFSKDTVKLEETSPSVSKPVVSSPPFTAPVLEEEVIPEPSSPPITASVPATPVMELDKKFLLKTGEWERTGEMLVEEDEGDPEKQFLSSLSKKQKKRLLKEEERKQQKQEHKKHHQKHKKHHKHKDSSSSASESSSKETSDHSRKRKSEEISTTDCKIEGVSEPPAKKPKSEK